MAALLVSFCNFSSIVNHFKLFSNQSRGLWITQPRWVQLCGNKSIIIGICGIIQCFAWIRIYGSVCLGTSSDEDLFFSAVSLSSVGCHDTSLLSSIFHETSCADTLMVRLVLFELSEEYHFVNWFFTK